jgi:hypothetical protein
MLEIQGSGQAISEAGASKAEASDAVAIGTNSIFEAIHNLIKNDSPGAHVINKVLLY